MLSAPSRSCARTPMISVALAKVDLGDPGRRSRWADRKRRPPPTFLFPPFPGGENYVPQCSRAIERATESPSPTPPVSGLRELSIRVKGFEYAFALARRDAGPVILDSDHDPPGFLGQGYLGATAIPRLPISAKSPNRRISITSSLRRRPPAAARSHRKSRTG